MKTHALDLVTLLESLSHRSALLNTPILDTLPGFVGACRGWVQVQKGAIASCVLEGINGDKMEGEQALSLLRLVTEWQVTLDAEPLVHSPAAYSSPATPPVPNEGIPTRRVVALPPPLLAPLPSKERLVLGMVFTMVNGQRGIQEIKAQLHLSTNSIDSALHHLWNLHLIDYHPSSSS
jgi:hypothetical protein